MALNSQRCELIFFAFFCLRQKIICTGTRLFGLHRGAKRRRVVAMGAGERNSLVRVRLDERGLGRHGQLGGVLQEDVDQPGSELLLNRVTNFENVRNRLLAVDIFLHDAILNFAERLSAVN